MKKQKMNGKLLALVILIVVLAAGAVLYFTVFRAKEAPKAAGFTPRLDTKTACTINVVATMRTLKPWKRNSTGFPPSIPTWR